MPSVNRSVVAVVVLVGSTTLVAVRAASAAQVTYTGQTRSVSVEARGVVTVLAPPGTSVATADLKSASAPDFGVFSAGLSATASNAPFDPDSVASASQMSSLSPTQVRISGSVAGFDNQPGFLGSGAGVGISRLDTTFTLDQATPYTFDVLITNYVIRPADGRGFYHTTLTGPGGSFDVNPGSLFSDTHRTITGTLVPGTYTLSLLFECEGRFSGANGASFDYTASLLIPEPSTALACTPAIAALAARRRSERRRAG